MRAFCNCTSLSEITLPDSIITLSGGAFVNCDGLTQINIPSSLENTTYSYYDMEDGCVFGGCDNLKTVVWGNGVSKLPVNLFRNVGGLKEITIPGTIKTISSGAFENCKNLENVIIAEGVNVIGSSAFIDCISLNNVDIPNSVTEVNSNAFTRCSSLEYIHLPDSITKMGDGLFIGCTNLKTVNIPSSRVNLMKNTFYDCKSLESIEIPPNVTAIREKAFYNCSNLKSVIFPEKLQTIEESAFYNCKSIEKIDIPNNVSIIAGNAFCNCEALSEITLGRGLTAINTSTFKNTNLSVVVIPDTITQINSYAFAECVNLKSIVIPQSVKSISSTGVFSYPKKMTIYGVKGSSAENYANSKGITFLELESKTFTDNTYNISVTPDRGIIPGLSLNIMPIGLTEDISSKIPGALCGYNIRFTDGVKDVQPGCSVKVTISVPEGKFGTNLQVFRKETNGSFTNMHTLFDPAVNAITFYTDHFSVYVLAEEHILQGDVNGDGKITATDLIYVRRYLSHITSEISPAADMNGDGKVTAVDLILLRRKYAGT